MASHDQLEMLEGKLPETGDTGDPQPEVMTQDQSSNEDAASDLPENNTGTPITHNDTDASSSLVVKSEPVEDVEAFPGLNSEPVDQNVASNLQQYQCEIAEKTESEVSIKHETYFYIDLSSTSVNPCPVKKPKQAKHKSRKNNNSKLKCKPFTSIGLNTCDTSGDIKSETVRWSDSSDTETYMTNTDSDEPVTSDIGSDVKIESFMANTSSDVPTEAETDTMGAGICNSAMSDSMASTDEDQDMLPGDEQEFDDPSASDVPRLSQPTTSVDTSLHPDDKFFPCDVYHKTSVSLDSKRRKVIHTGQRPYVCDVCLEAFTQAYHLKRHKMSHTGERPFVCDVCPRSFTQASDLKRHKMIHTGQRPYVCDVCYKTFTQSGTLKTHKMIHVNQKPFVCDMCNETLPTAYDLKTHKLTHTQVFVCDVCFNTFTRLDNLKAHKKIHTGQRPFACDMCSKTFIMSQHLKKHKRIHTGERPFVCAECKKTFARSDNLKTHMLTHTGQKPFVCDVCDKTFTQAGNLKTHKKTHATNQQDEVLNTTD